MKIETVPTFAADTTPQPENWQAGVGRATDVLAAAAATLQKGKPSTEDLVELASGLSTGVSSALVSFGRDFSLFGATRLSGAHDLERLFVLVDMADTARAVTSSAFMISAKAAFERARVEHDVIKAAATDEWDAQLAALPAYRAGERDSITRRRVELAANWIAMSTLADRPEAVLFDKVIGSLPIRVADLKAAEPGDTTGPSKELIAALAELEQAAELIAPHVVEYLKLQASDTKAAYRYADEHIDPLALKLLEPYEKAIRELPPFQPTESGSLSAARLMLQQANFLARYGNVHDAKLNDVERISRRLYDAGQLRVNTSDMASPDFPPNMWGVERTLEGLGLVPEGSAKRSHVGEYAYDAQAGVMRVGFYVANRDGQLDVHRTTVADLDALDKYLRTAWYLQGANPEDPRTRRLLDAGVSADQLARLPRHEGGDRLRVRESDGRITVLASDDDVTRWLNGRELDARRA